MKIFVIHNAGYDYQNLLYQPLKELAKERPEYEFILPHDNAGKRICTKELIQSSDVVLAEVSTSKTGIGIEIGWAEVASIPIFCIYQAGTKYSTSLTFVTKTFVSYEGKKELLEVVDKLLISQVKSC